MAAAAFIFNVETEAFGMGRGAPPGVVGQILLGRQLLWQTDIIVEEDLEVAHDRAFAEAREHLETMLGELLKTEV